jgi:hypothetical protein
MTTPFILMTLACVIMTITISLQWLRIKQQEKLISLQRENISDLSEKGFREVMGYGKVYRRRYRYINIENAGDNDTLNRTAEKYHEEDYDLDRDKSTDRLLVFVKSEEVESKPSGDNRQTYKEISKSNNL